MTATVTDANSGTSITFSSDAALLRVTAAFDRSPLQADTGTVFSWLPADDEPLSKVSLACALYEWGATYEKIGELYGVTRERIRQLLSRDSAKPIADIKRKRRENLAMVEAGRVAADAELVAAHVKAHGPSTLDDIVSATGLAREAAKRAWPTEFAHLQLAHLKHTSHQVWTDEEVLEALRAASMYEYPLTGAKYDEMLRVGQVHGPSRVRVMQRFGTWVAACDAAGVEAGVARAAPYESRWTDEELLNFVGDYLRAPNYGGTFAGYDVWRRETGIDAPSSGTLRNRLGSWSKVKRQALEMMWSNDE